MIYDSLIQMVCDGDLKHREKIDGGLNLNDLELIYESIKEENRDNFH